MNPFLGLFIFVGALCALIFILDIIRSVRSWKDHE